MIKISLARVSIGKFIQASPLIVWDLITDTVQWPLWGPTVKKVRFPQRFIRKDSKGQVLTIFGIWLPFVITEYEHARFWSWNVASIKATGHRIQPIETGGCSLWFDVPMIAVPYSLVCQMALCRIEKILCEQARLKA